MGTNFFLRLPPCPSCGHCASELHIGKSSAGWNFGLRIYPLLDNHAGGTSPDERLVPFGVNAINELDDWRPLFEKFPIFDEYGDPVVVANLIKNITERSHPNGLLSRATAGPEHMGPWHRHDANELKAGKGTYDLCNYEFS